VKRIALMGALASLIAGPASLIAGVAMAADLPNRYQAPYAPYDAPPMFSWTGFYGGINGGASFGGFTQGGGSYFGSTSGGMIGGTIGYNYQAGPIVVGLEGDIDWASVSGSKTPFVGVSSKASLDEVNTVRARIGYGYDRTLFYITGGYAGGSVSSNISNFASTPNLLMSQSHYLNGYAVGGGVEYLVAPHFSVKAEYLFISLGSTNYFGGTPSSVNAGIDYSSIKAGVNYHF